MEAARKIEMRYTYADYCTWDDGERWELIDGAAYAMAPAPSELHQDALLELAGQLRDFLKGKPCKVFIAPFDVRLNADTQDNTVVQPDILVVCDELKRKGGKGVVGAPDFIAEILSPSTSRHDRVTKFNLYQRSGVREYWIVDPDEKTVFVHILHDDKYFTHAYDDSDSIPVNVLEGCTIDLTEVFSGLQRKAE